MTTNIETLLTINEVAQLEVTNYETIKKNIHRNKIEAVKISVNSRKGFEYRISLKQLTEKAQRRYYTQQKSTILADNDEDKKYKNITVESLTDKQRAEIEFWKRIIKNWQAFVSEYPKQKTQKTNEFVYMWNTTNPDKKISVRTLNRKFNQMKEYGDIALTDCRLQSHKKGETTINEVVWDVFLQWYLDEAQPG